jgi:sialic acid synthase SpsE
MEPFTSVFRPAGGVTIIAEPANTHNGSIDYLIELTRAAAAAGADSIKYQLFEPDHMSVPDYEWYKVYQQIAIPNEQWPLVFDEARRCHLAIVVEVFDVETARFCVSHEVRAFKLNTADIANRSLVDYLAQQATAIFISVGGSEVYEIHELLARLGQAPAALVLNYGFQNYPTQPAHSHLAKIALLSLHFGLPVCFADHVAGDDPLALDLPCLGVAAGATSIEKHIVLKRTEERYDYYSSIEPGQFAALVHRIRQVELCLGPQTLELDAAEREYREKHKKCPVLRRALPAGHTLTEGDIDFKRANGAKDFTAVRDVVGRMLTMALPGNTPLRREHVR